MDVGDEVVQRDAAQGGRQWGYETSLTNKCRVGFRSWPKLGPVQKQHEYSWHYGPAGSGMETFLQKQVF